MNFISGIDTVTGEVLSINGDFVISMRQLAKKIDTAPDVICVKISDGSEHIIEGTMDVSELKKQKQRDTSEKKREKKQEKK